MEEQEAKLWQDLADALNALQASGVDVHFGDRSGPANGWHYAPWVYAINWAGGPNTYWNADTKRWEVGER